MAAAWSRGTLLTIASLAVVVMALGCGGANATDDAGDTPVNPADTVGNPCSTDTECDDREPCNGVETCSPETGLCVGGVVIADFTQCTTSDGRFASCVDGRCDLDYEEVFVPAGPFVMGLRWGTHDDGCLPARGASPSRVVTVSDFFMDRYEVTNRMFRRCQRVGRCPSDWPRPSFQRSPYLGDSAFDQYPVLYLQMMDAEDFCAYEGKRLPTEAEWEKAARGGCELVPPDTCDAEDQRLVPWDWPPLDDYSYTCREANYGSYVGGTCPNDTDRVGARPEGRSPYGVDDMIGNVEEWTADCVSDYVDCPGGCVDPHVACEPADVSHEWQVMVRGGSFFCSGALTHRALTNAISGGPGIGFRCVRSALATTGNAAAKAR